MNPVLESTRLWLAAAVALAACAVSALAVAQTAAPNVVPTFESLDRNADDRLSRTEAGYNRLLTEIFVTSDVNGDGFVSRAEYVETTSRGLVSLLNQTS